MTPGLKSTRRMLVMSSDVAFVWQRMSKMAHNQAIYAFMRLFHLLALMFRRNAAIWRINATKGVRQVQEEDREANF